MGQRVDGQLDGASTLQSVRKRVPTLLVVEELSDEIRQHYEQDSDEGRRLAQGIGQLEFVRTREVIHRHLVGDKLRIIDIGGGTGVHAAWLAEDGHDVHVVDAMPHHIEEVRARTRSSGTIAAEVGDARRLRFRAEAFDAALLLGPLYHLTTQADRLLALGEAARVTRPGGLIFVAAISRFASLFDGLARGLLFDPAFRRVVEQDLSDGQHRNPERRPGWFTTAYFHRPSDLRAEAERVGLEIVELVGLEGLARWLPQLSEHWADDADREAILFSARALEAEPTLLELSAHLLMVTCRP